MPRQKFNDYREEIFERYRVQLRKILWDKPRFWIKAEHETLFYFEYLKQYGKPNPAPSDGFFEWFVLNEKENPQAETIIRRIREIKDEVKEEEKLRLKDLSDDEGRPTEEFIRISKLIARKEGNF